MILFMNDDVQKVYKSFDATFPPGDDRSFVDRYIAEMKRRQQTKSSFSGKFNEFVATSANFEPDQLPETRM